MNEDLDRLLRSRKQAALTKLADHLAVMDDQDGVTSPMESDMLSLIVSGTLSGEDISKRYPAFYQKLLAHADLRQAFLDALVSVEAERAGTLVLMPEPSRARLAFLKKQLTEPVVEAFEQQKWRATWQRTLEQIEAVFSPQELVYRADPSRSEDPWFTLLRDEMTAAGTVFAVVLDCTISNDADNALSTFLSLAVTLGTTSEAVQFPLRAYLDWGGYQESVLIPEEGRARFPDIPLSAIFDRAQQKIQTGFSLVLETLS